MRPGGVLVGMFGDHIQVLKYSLAIGMIFASLSGYFVTYFPTFWAIAALGVILTIYLLVRDLWK